MAGTLYIVGTPIGNLGDFSERGIETLRSVDFIAAEDTRVTQKLLTAFNIKCPLVSNHEHNESARGEEIISRLMSGESCAVVTDAGMPVISDPGHGIVKLCHQNGIKIETVPGPTALTTALAASGMECRRFCFEGFMSTNKKERLVYLSSVKNEQRTLVYYEAPHKLVDTLTDMYEIFGNRDICLCRELTKLHEEIKNTTLFDALEYYKTTDPRGEYVLIVSGCSKEKDKMTLDDAVNLALDYVNKGSSPTSAAKAAALESGIRKGDIYKELINKA